MGNAGLPTPRNSRINRPEDVVPAGEHVGFPAVIKPVSGARLGCVGGALAAF
jgi:glutathione synthase/RimK-type ligase-like ATP-grasp enzyme